ncbi:unnamed protein product, partial [Rotaria sp. Silwood2]
AESTALPSTTSSNNYDCSDDNNTVGKTNTTVVYKITHPATIQHQTTEHRSMIYQTTEHTSMVYQTAADMNTIQQIIEQMSMAHETATDMNTPQQITKQMSMAHETAAHTSTLQHMTEQTSTVQHTTEQTSTVQHTTEKTSTVQEITEQMSMTHQTTAHTSMIQEIIQQTGTAHQTNSNELYLRYIDDIFITISWPIQYLSKQIDRWNKFDRNIKLKAEVGHSINCLDVCIENKNGELFTKVYHKPAYEPYYLPFNSIHPMHMKKNIPFEILIIKYCSTFDAYLYEREKLRMALLLNRYPGEFIDKQFSRVFQKYYITQPLSTKNYNISREKIRCARIQEKILIDHGQSVFRLNNNTADNYDPNYNQFTELSEVDACSDIESNYDDGTNDAALLINNNKNNQETKQQKITKKQRQRVYLEPNRIMHYMQDNAATTQ